MACISLMSGGAYAADPADSGKHDSHTPIEVTSDTLEVFQEENRAVFSGHVVAIQESIRLKADKMNVYYRKTDEKPPKDKKRKRLKKRRVRKTGAIKKIDAEGGVFLSTPEETASGNKGTYDVEHHEIHLIENVVLTRGKNVLKGSELTYNFDTGKSKLTGEQGGKQRVHALFVPEKTKEEQK